MAWKDLLGTLAFWRPKKSGQLSMFEVDEPTGGYLRRNGTYVSGHRARRRRKTPLEPIAAPPVDLLNLPEAAAAPLEREETPPLVQVEHVEDSALAQRRAALESLLARHGGIHFLREQAAVQPPKEMAKVLVGLANVAGCSVAEVVAAIGLEA